MLKTCMQGVAGRPVRMKLRLAPGARTALIETKTSNLVHTPVKRHGEQGPICLCPRVGQHSNGVKYQSLQFEL